MKKTLLAVSFAAWLFAGSSAWTALAEGIEKPNFLVIMADDLGYGDLSIYGAPDIRTPNIDSLMQRGVRFTDFTANSCVCSPSRAAFLTGRFPDLVGVPAVIRSGGGYLDPQAVTLPQMLKDHGYRTTLIGKWHVGHSSPNLPNQRGFEDFRGFPYGMIDDYWKHTWKEYRDVMFHNDKPIETAGTHATELFTDWAIADLKRTRDDDRPFFLFLSYNAPHSPLQPPKEALAEFRRRNANASEKRALLGALIEDLDFHVGRVIDALDEMKLSENTFVIFTSDNGGLLDNEANNGGFRGGKRYVYEGGLRVCTSFTWPKKFHEATVSSLDGTLVDLFPTLLDAAGIAYEGRLDGRSMLKPIQDGASAFPERTQIYCFHHPKPAKKKYAVRRGEWKLVREFTAGPYELYHLAEDPRETSDLASEHREKCSDLTRLLQRHLESVVPYQEIRDKHHQSMRE